MSRFTALLPRRPSLSERSTMSPSAAFLTDLQSRLAQAVTERDALAARMAQLAYDAEAGLPGAEQRQADAADHLALAERRVGKITAAIVVAEQRQAWAEQRQRDATLAEQVDAVKAALAARNEAARRCQEAMAAVTATWREWIDATTALTAALPASMAPSRGVVATLGEVVTVAKAELYRLGGNPAVPALSFPGGHVADLRLQGNPAALPSLLDVMADASAATLRHVGGAA